LGVENQDKKGGAAGASRKGRGRGRTARLGREREKKVSTGDITWGISGDRVKGRDACGGNNPKGGGGKAIGLGGADEGEKKHKREGFGEGGAHINATKQGAR